MASSSDSFVVLWLRPLNVVRFALSPIDDVLGQLRVDEAIF